MKTKASAPTAASVALSPDELPPTPHHGGCYTVDPVTGDYLPDPSPAAPDAPATEEPSA
jgi:hypothetical protein